MTKVANTRWVAPRRALLVVAALLASLTRAHHPRAARASEPAMAETLYQEGRALMAAGRTAEACAKFEESLRLDQATGTLLNLAVCHETLGRFATAWAEFRAAAAIATHDRREDRSRFAREHLNRIEPHLSRLKISVPDTSRVTGLRIALDGTTLGEAAWNVPTPIDPGAHVVEADAPGHVALAQTVVVGTAASAPEVVVVLSPAPHRAQAATPSPARHQDALSREAGLRSAGAAPYLITGAGVAALAVGAVFGVRALSQWSERNRDCPMEACTEAGLAASERAERAALIADVAIGAGVVAVAVGGYLFYRAHARSVVGAPDAVALTGTQKQRWRMIIAAAPTTPLGMGLGIEW